MPPKLHDQIRRIAEAESRSMNQQIIHVLQQFIRQYLDEKTPTAKTKK